MSTIIFIYLIGYFSNLLIMFRVNQIDPLDKIDLSFALKFAFFSWLGVVFYIIFIIDENLLYKVFIQWFYEIFIKPISSRLMIKFNRLFKRLNKRLNISYDKFSKFFEAGGKK